MKKTKKLIVFCILMGFQLILLYKVSSFSNSAIKNSVSTMITESDNALISIPSNLRDLNIEVINGGVAQITVPIVNNMKEDIVVRVQGSDPSLDIEIYSDDETVAAGNLQNINIFISSKIRESFDTIEPVEINFIAKWINGSAKIDSFINVTVIPDMEIDK